MVPYDDGIDKEIEGEPRSYPWRSPPPPLEMMMWLECIPLLGLFSWQLRLGRTLKTIPALTSRRLMHMEQMGVQPRVNWDNMHDDDFDGEAYG